MKDRTETLLDLLDYADHAALDPRLLVLLALMAEPAAGEAAPAEAPEALPGHFYPH